MTAPMTRLPRWWIPLLTILVVTTGMAYTLWWPLVVRHSGIYWIEPGDIWFTIRSAHWIGWGGFSFIYSSNTALVTLPGFEILLTPIVMLSSKLGLSETAPGLLPVLKPTAWLLVGPLILGCTASALYAVDRLCRTLRLSVSRRLVLLIVEAAALWPTIALWGHAEDVLALAFVVFAFDRALHDHWTSSAWLMGAALCMQLFTVAAVPVFLGLAGTRRALPWLTRASVLPGAILLAVLIPNPHATLNALFNQPNFPTTDYPTPWVLLAPKLARHAVASGPGRVIGLVIACGIGLLATRFRRDPRTLIWLMAIALGVRCLFEAVMDPYYVAPAIALVLVVAADSPWLRFGLVSVAAAGLTELTYYRPGIWIYWSEMAAVMFMMFFFATRRTGLGARRALPPSRPLPDQLTSEPLTASISSAG